MYYNCQVYILCLFNFYSIFRDILDALSYFSPSLYYRHIIQLLCVGLAHQAFTVTVFFPRIAKHTASIAAVLWTFFQDVHLQITLAFVQHNKIIVLT